MSDRPSPSYLRLVSDRTGRQELTDSRREPEQLSFPYPEPLSLIFACTMGMVREQFLSLLRDVAPRWTIDFRTVPSFEALAGSRSYAFSLFDSGNTNYIDFLGRMRSLGETDLTDSDRWAAMLTTLLKDPPQAGPYLVLFDDLNILSTAELAMPSALKAVIGKKPDISVLSEARAEA